MVKSERKNPKKGGAVIRLDWMEAMLELPEDIRLKTVTALWRYVLYGEVPEDPTIRYGAFAMMKTTLDKDAEAFEEKMTDLSEKRSRAGAEGARQRERNKAKQANSSKTSKTSKIIQNKPSTSTSTSLHNLKLNCVCEEKHTLTQEEKEDLEHQKADAEENLKQARDNMSQNPRAYKLAKYELEAIEAKLDAGMTFDRFNSFLQTKCPSIYANMQGLSMEQYAYWLQTADRVWLADVCQKMDGRKDVKEKYDGLHSALKSWWDRDFNNPKNQ